MCYQLRNHLINTTDDWVTTQVQVLSETKEAIAFMKGDVITILTNIGSPVSACHPLPPLGRILKYDVF